MHNICRCCLIIAKDEIKYFRSDDECQTYKQVSGISISAHDNLTKLLCGECYNFITSIKLFQQCCVLSHNALLECTNNIGNTHKVNINDKISERRLKISAMKKQYLFKTINRTNNLENKYESVQKNNEDLVLNTDENDLFVNNVETDFDIKVSIMENNNLDIAANNQISITHDKNEVHKNRKYRNKKKTQVNYVNQIDNLSSKYITIKYFSKQQVLEEMARLRLSTDFVKAPYKCVPCAKIFSTEFSVNDHSFKHSLDAGKFLCDICEQRHSVFRVSQRHIKGHLCLYICKICDKNLHDEKAATFHIQSLLRDGVKQKNYIENISEEYVKVIRLHNELISGNAKPVQCKICSKECKNEIILKTHMKLHDDANNFKCAHCSKIYAINSSLVRHMRIHTGERPHVCPHCNATFTQRAALIIHIKTVHERLTALDFKGRYRCEPCKKSYASQGKLNEHLKIGAKHIKSDAYKLSCDRCGQHFLRSRELVFHTARYHDDKIPLREYICHLCGGIYASARSLSEHVMRHKGITPHKCEYCDRQFVTRTSLKEHIANNHAHIAGIEFRCSTCSERFSARKELRRHNALIHANLNSNEKFCCGKEFTRKDSHKVHSAIHTGGKKYRCEHCAYDFSQLSNLKRHLRSKHVHKKKIGQINNQKEYQNHEKTQDNIVKDVKISLTKDFVDKIPNFSSIIDPNLQSLKKFEILPNFGLNNASNISNDKNTNTAETSIYNNVSDGFNLNSLEWNSIKNTTMFDNSILNNFVRKDSNNISENEIQLNIIEANTLTIGSNLGFSTKDDVKNIDSNLDENSLSIINLPTSRAEDIPISKETESQVTGGNIY